MCGIFFLKSKVMALTHKSGWNGIINAIELLKTRGPDRTEIRIFESEVLGFCRLAINSISKIGDQPFCMVVDLDRRISLIMNGEIYNHKKIQKKYKFPNTTGSDCEVMIHLYLKFGITSIIDQLDGVFAFTLVDRDNVYFGRDAIGVRPLYFRQKDKDIVIASTPLSLEGFSYFGKTQQVPPGSYYHFYDNRLDLVKWYQIPRVNLNTDYNWQTNIRKVLIAATRKRLLSDRPIGCLLSGGLDSSLIASILSRLMAPRKLQTFSIGFNENATDILAARKVANFLQTDHHEIILPMEKALEAIPEVILATGTYDITTIRASVGMYLICQWISQNTDIKVLFSGEGSDELFCGYLYFHYAPSNEVLEEESRRLVKELPYFDVLRSDRTVSCHGLELRVPFLDKQFLKMALGLPGELRHPQNVMEKYILRKSFEKDDSGNPYIPEDILWRRKEGFSDGVGSVENPWYIKIQETVKENFTEKDLDEARELGLYEPVTPESVYYFKMYHEYYKETGSPIPHHWMPKWQDTNDPSGRVMPAFSENVE